MSENSRPNKDKPKAVSVTVSKAADFKNRKRPAGSSLTLREYKELSVKDRQTLTPRQQKQIDEAQCQLRKTAEMLSSQYDFSAITKLAQAYAVPPIAQQSIAKALAVDTSPMLKIVADMQKMPLISAQPALTQMIDLQKTVMPAIQAIYKSTVFTQNQFTALAAIQKSLITFPTESLLTTVKGMQDAFQAPLIARTMLADFQTMHERVVRDLNFDIGSLRATIEFNHYETVDFVLDDVTTNEDNLTASALATQTNTVGNITVTDNASLLLAFNDLRQEVHDLKYHLLTNDNPQGKLLVAPSKVHFQRIGSSVQIQLGTLKVTVTLSSNYTRLARFLLSSPDNIVKEWDIEDLAREVFDAHFANAQDEEEWKIKIKGYANHFNQQVMIASGGKMPKFIDSNNKGVVYFINPDYLNL